jgi:hypothetical protein
MRLIDAKVGMKVFDVIEPGLEGVIVSVTEDGVRAEFEDNPDENHTYNQHDIKYLMEA